MKVHKKGYIVIYNNYAYCTHKLQLKPIITVQHTSKIQGSAVEAFIQLTVFS